MEIPHLDAMDITRNWVRWHPVGRTDAVRACTHRPVAVLHRVAGQDVASWLYPSSRFFIGNEPYRYDSLRYYIYTGAELGKLKGMKLQPPGEESEWELAEAEDGEPISLGSPTTKVPSKPNPFSPPEPSLELAAKLASMPGMPSVPGVPGMPTVPGLPAVPGLPSIPGLPAVPGAPAIPGLPPIPEIPKIPEVPAIPELPGIPRPVQILLVNEKGVPMADLPFQVRWPDGTVESGKSDRAGLISYPKNTQAGELVLTITDFTTGLPGAPTAADAAALAPQAPSAPSAPAPPSVSGGI